MLENRLGQDIFDSYTLLRRISAPLAWASYILYLQAAPGMIESIVFLPETALTEQKSFSSAESEECGDRDRQLNGSGDRFEARSANT